MGENVQVSWMYSHFNHRMTFCPHFWSKDFQRGLVLECQSSQAALTEPSDALAPTLSPAAFQQTSKIPPVPR